MIPKPSPGVRAGIAAGLTAGLAFAVMTLSAGGGGEMSVRSASDEAAPPPVEVVEETTTTTAAQAPSTVDETTTTTIAETTTTTAAATTTTAAPTTTTTVPIHPPTVFMRDSVEMVNGEAIVTIMYLNGQDRYPEAAIAFPNPRVRIAIPIDGVEQEFVIPLPANGQGTMRYVVPGLTVEPPPGTVGDSVLFHGGRVVAIDWDGGSLPGGVTHSR